MSFKIKEGENSPTDGEVFTPEEMIVVNMGLNLVKKQLEKHSKKEETPGVIA
jgi:hypothetical protein